MKHTAEWNAYLDALKVRAENADTAETRKAAREELTAIAECEKAAGEGDITAQTKLAAYKAGLGIDFAESLAFLEARADADDTVALNALGFLYAGGVFNEFDSSKSSLIDISSEESAAKADAYFEKSTSLGSIRAKLERAMKYALIANNAETEAGERKGALCRALNFFNRAKRAVRAGEACDCDFEQLSEVVGDWISMAEGAMERGGCFAEANAKLDERIQEAEGISKIVFSDFGYPDGADAAEKERQLEAKKLRRLRVQKRRNQNDDSQNS